MTKGIVLVETRDVDVDAIIKRHLKFLPLDWGIHFVKEGVRNIREYNQLLTSERFWQDIPFEKALIVQHDTGILREGINEFLEYDFIGAPLKHFPFPYMNGGLSLRTRKTMLFICKQFKYDTREDGNEDIFFINKMNKYEIGKLPTREMADNFSCETVFKLGSFGYHNIDRYLTPEQCKQIRTQYE